MYTLSSDTNKKMLLLSYLYAMSPLTDFACHVLPFISEKKFDREGWTQIIVVRAAHSVCRRCIDGPALKRRYCRFSDSFTRLNTLPRWFSTSIMFLSASPHSCERSCPSVRWSASQTEMFQLRKFTHSCWLARLPTFVSIQSFIHSTGSSHILNQRKAHMDHNWAFLSASSHF